MDSQQSKARSTREVYDAIATKYGVRHSGISNPFRKLQHFVPNGGSYALDVGCGPGRDAIQLAARFDRVLALDVSENMVSLAQQASPSQNIEFRRLDILDLYDGSFDFIWANAVLHHLDPTALRRCFDVFARCSRDKCSIAITLRTDIKNGFDDEYPGYPRMYFKYNICDLDSLAKRIGFTLIFNESENLMNKSWLFIVLQK